MKDNWKGLAWSPLLSLPFFLPLWVHNQYYVHGIFCRILIYAILVISLDVVVGYLGDVSIGHAGLFAVGAYSTAILTAGARVNPGHSMMFLPHLSFIAALPTAILLTALVGLLMALPALRSSGPYLAFTTIAIGLIITTLISEQEVLTNGTKGIFLEPLRIAGVSFDGNRFVWIAYSALLLVIFSIRNLAKSYWGRALEAIKHSSAAAECCGIDRNRMKLAAFALSAAMAGLAGALFVHLDDYVAPDTFSLEFSILTLMALILGGVRSITGSIVAVSLMVLLPDWFTGFRDYRLMFFGFFLLLTLYIQPSGLAGLVYDCLAGMRPSDDLAKRLLELSERASSDKSSLFSTTVEKGKGISLTLEKITLRFGGLDAVDILNLKVQAGTIHALIGPNGSGKSTVVNLISGVYLPDAGRIRVGMTEVTCRRAFERAQLGVARTFQNVQLFGDLTVLENVLIGMHPYFRSPLWKVLLGLPSVPREQRALEIKAFRLLQLVGLEKFAFDKARNLAYGQARRLEIARALALDPVILILDEPAAGLTEKEIQDLNVIQLLKNHMSILLIEHHMRMVMSLADEITVLDFGQRIATGVPREVQSNPVVIEAYLGTEAEA